LCLLLAESSVKPPAHEIANHMCCDGNKEADNSVHDNHLLPITGTEGKKHLKYSTAPRQGAIDLLQTLFAKGCIALLVAESYN